MAGPVPLLLALAAQGSAADAAQGQAPAPAPAAEPTMMIVEFPRGARAIGLPRRCPGAPAGEEEGVCLAELYEGRATIVRRLSGPRPGRNGRLRLTAHARIWPEGTRMLVVTRPFEDRGTEGDVALWWRLPEADGDYCVETRDLADWGDNPVTRQFAEGYRRRFRAQGYLERADFRCINR